MPQAVPAVVETIRVLFWMTIAMGPAGWPSRVCVQRATGPPWLWVVQPCTELLAYAT